MSLKRITSLAILIERPCSSLIILYVYEPMCRYAIARACNRISILTYFCREPLPKNEKAFNKAYPPNKQIVAVRLFFTLLSG